MMEAVALKGESYVTLLVGGTEMVRRQSPL